MLMACIIDDKNVKNVDIMQEKQIEIRLIQTIS